jgi:hypothetical protein
LGLCGVIDTKPQSAGASSRTSWRHLLSDNYRIKAISSSIGIFSISKSLS